MIKFVLTTLALSFSLLTQAETQNDLWIARMTEDLQCEKQLSRSKLGQALEDLETKNSVSVEQALVSKLEGLAFCSSCDCPSGNFYVAKIQITAQTGNNLQGGWKIIDPRSIRKLAPVRPLEPIYETQPVFPDR
jgi:hypothetical protein